MTKGQAQAALVLVDTALGRAVDDAASHFGHELLDRPLETPPHQRRVDLDGTLHPAMRRMSGLLGHLDAIVMFAITVFALSRAFFPSASSIASSSQGVTVSPREARHD
jgi:hypothetical protein